MEKIKIPFVVTREERAQIREAYLSGIESADAEKLNYIVENLPKVLRRLKKSDEAWHVQIADVAERFRTLLHRRSGVAAVGRRELVAALYYLCHPFEVIPDYVPGRGYADDALVLNTCMSRLRQRGIKLEEPSRDQPLPKSLEQQAE
ncbi:YkvA family protein [Stieleria sp. TO1_6]|uniref:YkvA family protein n=1 Tax=Stieleria tagensis TaxID=2956795 RepID=UPI00209AC84D|nr:YkvA family protein [Stieleria tagensis]MCO8123531.1 YkvA family protein [Stieleria tagensis]